VKVWVWADVTPDGPAPSALELLTKARELGDEAAAIALGPGAKTSADTLGEHGARTVFASDDEVFANHLAQPAAHVLAGLVEEHRPDLILFPASYDARDVAGRLQARTGSTLMANAGSAGQRRSSSWTSSPRRSGTPRSAPPEPPWTPAGCRTAIRSGKPARP